MKRRVHIEFLSKDSVQITTLLKTQKFDVSKPCIINLVDFKVIPGAYEDAGLRPNQRKIISPYFVVFEPLELSKEEVVIASLYVQSSVNTVDRVDPIVYWKFKQRTWSASVWVD